MNFFRFNLAAIITLILVGCNKDEEIIDGDWEPDPPVLGYEVMEYIPAPGQYINDIVTGFDNINTQEEACEYATQRFYKNLYVSLGAWGGYIIVKFDQSVENTGDYDFAIGSNSFTTSNEPGIVWVMQDENHNGKADDTWYELRGSHFGEEGYERNYWVKYSRPEAKSDTPWIDSNGETGLIYWVGNYHSQDFYYPNWIKEDSYTLYGSRLPQQAIQNPETGEWTNLPFDWGYADNMGLDFLESYHFNRFKISDAVTADNLHIDIPHIDFIKVQTAINGSAGWLGENSTEITGFFILN
ncbi:MAG: hypothetical protein J1F12_01740 [Muribaculaceae bacterium]|nr:hypothetical protein [Muribaculaceae bacterium]